VLRFTRLPFGWVLSPGIFVAAVTQLLGPDWYVDDKIKGFDTIQRLLEHLDSMLTTCAARGFKLKGSKCRLWLPQLAALGYRISTSGITVATCKLADLQDQIPDISTPVHLGRWLGLLVWISPVSFPALDGEVREARSSLQRLATKSRFTTGDVSQVHALMRQVALAVHGTHPIEPPIRIRASTFTC